MAMTRVAKHLIRESPLLDDFAAYSRAMTMVDRDPGYPRSFETPAIAADSGRVAMIEAQQTAESESLSWIRYLASANSPSKAETFRNGPVRSTMPPWRWCGLTG